MQMCDLYNQSVCASRMQADITLPLPMTLFINALLTHFRKVCCQITLGQFYKTKQSGAIRTISRHFISDPNSIFLCTGKDSPRNSEGL